MDKRDADVRIRKLVGDYSRIVARTLGHYGVATADQQDIAQEVFLSAHSLFLRDNHPALDAPVMIWRAWLREIARRHAANYRRKSRLVTEILSDLQDTRASDPEKAAARRELLILLLDRLDAKSREIVLDVSFEGIPWPEIAEARGITIDQARYYHSRAVARMERALLRWEKKEREPAVVPISIADLLTAAILPLAIPDNMHPRIFALRDRSAGAPATAREKGRWTKVAAGLPSHAGAMVISGVLVWFVRGPGPGEVFPAVPSTPPGDHAAPAPETTTPASREIPSPEAPSTSAAAIRLLPPAARQSGAPERRSLVASEEEQLLDQAQAALNANDAHAALTALAKRDGHFAGGPSTSVRQRLLVRACALPAARAEVECAGVVTAPAD